MEKTEAPKKVSKVQARKLLSEEWQRPKKKNLTKKHGKNRARDYAKIAEYQEVLNS